MKSAPRPREIAAQRRTYLAAAPPESRRRLRAIRDAIRAAVPDAVEVFTYGIPGFKLDGRPLAWYASWTAHTSLYPLTGVVRRTHAAALKAYETSKGTVKFPLDRPLPLTLVKRLVKTRAAEIRQAVKSRA